MGLFEYYINLNTMKKYIFTWAVATFVLQNSLAQDLHYSNIHSLTQQVFPEFAGLNSDLEASVYFRDQWKSIGSDFGAIGASFAMNMQPKLRSSKSHLAGGLTCYRERMNLNSSLTSVRMVLVQHQVLTRFSKMSVGLNMGFINAMFDPSQGSWGSQHNGLFFDPNAISGESFNRSGKTGLDIGTGILYSLKHKKANFHAFQVGVSLQHINRPNLSVNNDRSGYLPIKWVGFSTFNLKMGNKGSTFQTAMLIQKQSTFITGVFGGIFKLKLDEKAKTTSSFSKIQETFFGFGGYYRTGDSFIASVMFQKSSFNLNFAYDFTLSTLKMYNYSRGAFEIQLQYTIPSFEPTNRF